jgi:hypothetical protein
MPHASDLVLVPGVTRSASADLGCHPAGADRQSRGPPDRAECSEPPSGALDGRAADATRTGTIPVKQQPCCRIAPTLSRRSFRKVGEREAARRCPILSARRDRFRSRRLRGNQAARARGDRLRSVRRAVRAAVARQTARAGLRTCSSINNWPTGRSTRRASAAARRVSGIVQNPSVQVTVSKLASGNSRLWASPILRSAGGDWREDPERGEWDRREVVDERPGEVLVDRP